MGSEARLVMPWGSQCMSYEWFEYWGCSLKKFFGVDLAGPAVAATAKARMEAATEAFMLTVRNWLNWIRLRKSVLVKMVRLAKVLRQAKD
jgi:hypothetical protein